MKYSRARKSASLAILTTAGLLLASCSSSGASSSASGSFKGKTLTVQHNPISSNASGYNDYYNALAAAFHKATGAKIKYVTSSLSTDEQFPQIEATHHGPDVIGGSTSASAYASGTFVHFSSDDWKTLGGQAQFNPGQLGDSGPTGGPYDELPAYNNPYAMVYNTTLFKKAGITHPPKTWTEYVQDAQKINDPSAGIYGTGFDPADGANQDSWKTPFYFLGSYGGTFYNKKGDPTIATDQAVKAYSFWFDWYRKFHIVNPASLSWQNTQMVAAFAAGKIGILPAVNSSVVPLFEQGAVGKNFAFAVLPSTPYGMTSMPKGGSTPSRLAQAGWFVGTYANKALALQFLKVTLRTDMQVRQYKDTGHLPVTSAGVSAVLKSGDAQLYKPYLDALQSHENPEPFQNWWNQGQLGLVAMTSQLASKLASTGHLTDAQIRSALEGVQKSVSQGQ